MQDLVEKFEPQIPGGRGEDLDPSDFDVETLKKGIKVEMEHTTDQMLALEIATDHLAENPRYYDLLETIDPHDGKEPSQAAQEPVRRRDKDAREFITGDDIVELMSTVAAELIDRGQQELAKEVTEFVTSLTVRS